MKDEADFSAFYEPSSEPFRIGGRSDLIRIRRELPERRRTQMKTHSRTVLNDHLPSRRDIRDACSRIQSDWSDSERRKRAGLPREEPWAPPTIRSAQLGFDADSDSDS